MCGILILIRYPDGTTTVTQKNQFTNFYKKNNSGIELLNDFEFDENSFSKKLKFENLDFSCAYQTLFERGVDSVAAYRFVINYPENENGDGDIKYDQVFTKKIENEKNLIEIFQEENNLNSQQIEVTIVSSVLKMRGEDKEGYTVLVEQPVVEKTFILSYNGEIFEVYKEKSKEINPKIFERLEAFTTHDNDTLLLKDLYQISQDEEIKFEEVLECLEGDFSIAIFDFKNHYFLIFKDIFGKRSLVFTQGDSFMAFSSLSFVSTDLLKIEKYSGDLEELDFDIKGLLTANFEVDQFNEHKFEKMKKSIRSKYFSNYGLIMKRWCIEVPGNTKTSIDLSTKKSIILDVEPLDKKFENFCFGEIQKMENGGSLKMEDHIQKIKEMLFSSVRSLIENTSYLNKDQIKEKNEKFTKSKIGVLFSGGLDSTLLAFLAAKIVPEEETIDLFNVSFNQDQSHDRKICLQSFQELSEIFGTKKFNLILIDKNYSELVKEKDRYIYQRIYPQSSILDFNIGIVLNQAASKSGILYPSGTSIKSEVRCLLNGLGADEIFCGYRRYRTAYLRGGNDVMFKEMQFGKI